MKRKLINLVLGSIVLLAGGSNGEVVAQGNCYTYQGCSNYANFGYNSSGASSLEYDNYVSAFHATGVRDIDGTIKVWGENSGPAGTQANSRLLPTTVNAGNFPGLTGTPLKIAVGSGGPYNQFVLLTSDNKLWAWGATGVVLSTALKPSPDFGLLSIGLPTGVTAANIKMMLATCFSLAITTCDGSVFVLSNDGSMRGAGGAGSATAWSQVQRTSGAGGGFLTDIVATRGASNGLVALDASGNLWTWGNTVWLGNGSVKQSLNAATPMALPPGSGPVKMIGYTSTYTNGIGYVAAYYVLYENGALYAMGSNNSEARLVGDFTFADKPTWVQPLYPSSSNPALPGIPMNNIKWISPNEHDLNTSGMINVLTADKKILNWGQESGANLGRGIQPDASTRTGANPGEPTSFQTGYSNANIIAVESGGHTTMMLRSCEGNFGYIGHRVNGSMGDNSSVNNTDNIVHFNTSAVQVCGAPTVAATLEPSVVGPYCSATSLTMIGLPTGGTFSIDPTSTAAAVINATTGALTVSGNGTLRVSYTVYESACGGPVTINRVLSVAACSNIVTVPGNIWIDTDKDGVIDAGETGASNGFWANLTDPAGNVIVSVRVNTDGTYSFNVPKTVLTASGNYNVVITNSSKEVGETVPDSDTPAGGYIYTGSNRGGTTSVIISATGKVNVGNLSAVAGGTTTNPVNIGINNSSLPVNFGNVQASITGSILSVSWTSLTETNNSHFEIEASTDGQHFTIIGEVKTKTLNGNSDTSTDYSFELEKGLAGWMGGASVASIVLMLSLGRRKKFMWALTLVSVIATLILAGCQKTVTMDLDSGTKLFIRIKQVDRDGAFTYSKIINVVKK